jgi:hypothetical protein
MTKLNQIIAIASGKKSSCIAAITEINKKMQKVDLFSGLKRVYQPLDEEGEKIPSESKIVQQKVKTLLSDAGDLLVGMFDVIAMQEFANCNARADIKVGGTVIASQVPVTYLMFLEKQLDNVKTVVSNVPVLSADVNWTQSESDPTVYVSDTVMTTRTKKIPKAFVKTPATDKFPAQVDVFTEDVIVGNWSKIDISGAIPIRERDAILKRVDTLRDAVKVAREEANSVSADKVEIGRAIMSFILG